MHGLYKLTRGMQFSLARFPVELSVGAIIVGAIVGATDVVITRLVPSEAIATKILLP